MRAAGFDHSGRFMSVIGLATNLKVRFAADDLSNSLPDDRLIVHDQDAFFLVRGGGVSLFGHLIIITAPTSSGGLSESAHTYLLPDRKSTRLNSSHRT